jgi:serine/threonine protein kinase/tetratricopeptide (TPR) repeat protein
MSASDSRSAVVLQLAEEFLERYRQGQRPSLREYIDRHPELAAEIKEVFPAMALMENVALADESLVGAATGPATPVESLPPQQLGDYRILREVGRGGMGIVYEAEQVSLGRHVALKVLPRQMFVDDSQRRRFEREAKAAAKLHHTNIVPVFGVGEHDGMPYYVMQFIQGLGLDEVLEELKRMQGSGPATATGGELRVSRKDVSAADVARSLMTGDFDLGAGGVSPLSESQEADAPRSGESTVTGKLSDSFTISSSVKLPGSDGAMHGKSKKATYWQSVAQIGLQVAEALEYAHKQGIQHRDIKPSNLLLDTHGTVWVTDFGLARHESEDRLTQTGDIVGTLRYLPPEAFEGRADKRADIYSLGLTLYEMLALRPAYEERDRHRLFKRITTEEPAHLDKLNRSIPRDLATIIHKAIDREPSRRYQTAAELAADLQRFLDDEPIQARRISTTERLVRLCRHHPGVASLTGILVLLMVGVTVVSLFAAAHFDRLAQDEARAAENERLARQEAEQAKNHEAALRGRAEEATKQADQQKRQAESNFAKARKAVDDYFTTVSESQLLQVPGMQPLRRDLLQSALMFYLDFLKERGDDPTVGGELAAAYVRLGKIYSELGKDTEANQAWESARKLYEGLTKAAPESVEWQHGLAQCYFWLGRNDEAIVAWEKLVQPNRPRFHKELAEVYNSRAVQFIDSGQVAKGLEYHQKALVLRETLVRLTPNDPEAHRDLGGSLNNIGVLLAQKGRIAEALVMYRRAAERAEAAWTQAPQVIINGRFLTVQLNNVASIERQLGHADEALAAFRRVAEIWRKLAAENPAVPSLHSNLWGAYRNLAIYQRELKQIEESRRTLRLASAVIDRLPSDGPEAQFKLACVRAECAAILGQGKTKLTAEEKAEQKVEADLAMDALRAAVTTGFRDVERFRKATELNVLRDRMDFRILQMFVNSWAVAAPSNKPQLSFRVLVKRQEPTVTDPNNKQLRSDRAASRHALALIQLDAGNLDQAQKHLQEAIALRETLVKDEPKNAQHQADLAASRFALGDCYWLSGELADGAKLMQQELHTLEAIRSTAGDRVVASSQLLAMRRNLAQHYVFAGLWPEALALCRDSSGRFIQLKETTEYDYFCVACLALLAGDAAAYRNICETMVKQFGDKRDFYSLAWLAWASTLADGSGIEPATAIKRARMMAESGSPNELWQCMVLGLAHYRAGQFAEAEAQANKSSATSPTWESRILNWPVLALAHHRMGHTSEAKQWLDKSKQQWRRLSPLTRSARGSTIMPSSTGHWHETWHDWLVFQILLREASLAITGSPPVEDAYNHAHRSLLYSRLGEAAKADAQWQAAIKILPREPMIWLSRANQFVEQERDKEAVDVLEKIEAFQSNDGEVWKECGHLRFALGQTDKATAAFEKAVDLLGDKAVPDEAATSEPDKLFSQLAEKALLQRLTAAIERNPEDMSKRTKRGEWYARHRRWKEAAADFLNVLEHSRPNDTWPWLHAAPALVAAGDRAGYLQLCRAMRKQFSDPQDPVTAERLAKVHLLLADAGTDLKWVGQIADRSVASGKNNNYEVYFIFCKILADYRRGDYRAVLEARDALMPPRNQRLDVIVGSHPILAMAHYRLGDTQAANEQLAQAAKMLDQQLPDPDRFLGGDAGYDHDWLTAWLLYREAKVLIEGNKAEQKK